MPDALISIKPLYVKKILSGAKKVEIRRRALRVPSGTRLWIYSTVPDACVVAATYVQRVETDSPVDIWSRIEGIVGMSEEDFIDYSSGLHAISALFLEGTERLEPVLDLAKIRDIFPRFQPPQFYSWLPNSGLLKLLESNPRFAQV
jgi:predicted transcriptional regulator